MSRLARFTRDIGNGARVEDGVHDAYVRVAGGSLIPFNRDRKALPDVPLHVEDPNGEPMQPSAVTNELVTAAWQAARAKLGEGATEEHRSFVLRYLAEQQKQASPATKKVVMRPPGKPGKPGNSRLPTPQTTQPAEKNRETTISLEKLFKIPGLRVKAQPPRVRVSFDFGELGQQAAKYHWVLRTGRTVSLVFDTRFDLIEMYRPAVTEDRQLSPMSMVIQSDDGERSYDYEVYSGYTVLEFGVWTLLLFVVCGSGRNDDPYEREEFE